MPLTIISFTNSVNFVICKSGLLIIVCALIVFWFLSSFIHFPVGSQLEHRAPFGVSVITHTIRHMVGLLWTSDQPVAEASTYTGQHNI
jgi:hypothetical protein